MSENNFVKLASINVSDKIEKKQGLSYLSWAWAVDQLMRADSNANWSYGDPMKWGETVMVYCTVTAFGKSMTAHLPVMDYKNRAVPNPDAFQVNTAMQRCLVKAIALHGLGLYIYAGEDLPEEPRSHEPRRIEETEGTDPWAVFKPAESARIRAVGQICIQAFNEGKEWSAFEEYTSLLDKAKDNDFRNNVILALWDMWKPHSALRAYIKKAEADMKAGNVAHN